ncbi:MAG: nitroreductase family protein [Bacteroidales bacterium]|nr:nitroreductase family protein [Bacteroidales bacterium]
MADNYLENRMEALREKQKRTVVVKQNPSLESLLKRNRSFRGYDRSVEVSEDQLLEMVKTVTWVASGMNAQPLRFRLVTGEEAAKVHPLVKLGAALPEEHLPHPGEEPSAYIVVGSVVPENRIVDMDLGIAAQSILLKATEMGFGGIFILNFNPEAVQQELSMQLKPIAVLAIGKPSERIFLMPCNAGDSLNYYRKEGIHYVPKIKIEDLIIK